jgi:putative FmdB family regulatory protein
MPTFDFRCSACAHTFEFSRPFGSAEIPQCPACGNAETEKLITPPAIQFKGSGFYKTDSRTVPRSTQKKETTSTELSAGKETTETKEKKSADQKSATGDSSNSSTSSTSSGSAAPPTAPEA